MTKLTSCPASIRRTKLRRIGAHLAAACLLAAALQLYAQSSPRPTPQDPANLAGNQIKPETTVRDIPADQGATALWQTLTALRTRASLMMIVAHPDDEDSGMLTYEARGHGVHTAMLTLTRGEGGQNIMSGDFNDALGLVRTQELLAAGRYFGIDQLWGTEIDFGFSKTKEESLAQWDHDRVLYDAVRAVRLYRPLVITAVFAGAVTDGHGQHQVSGEIAQEVYTAAGDPSIFPDQIAAGLQPWSPAKVYARVPFYSISPKGLFDYATGKYAPASFYNYVTKQTSITEPMANVRIPEGQYSPILGMSFLQFARLGLGLQKSQNGGMGIPPAGMVTVPYHRYASRVAAPESEQSFFDGIDTSLPGIATLAPDETTFLKHDLTRIATLIDQATAAYSIATPDRTAPLLHDGLKATDALLAKVAASSLSADEKYNLTHELTLKRTQFNQALVEALGLSLRAQVAPAHENTGPFAGFQDAPDTLTAVVPGSSFAVQLHLINPTVVPLKVTQTWLTDSTGAHQSTDLGPKQPIASYQPYDRRIAVTLPADAPVTRPPFIQPNVKAAFYTVANPSLRNASLAPPALTAWAKLDYDGVPIELGEVVQTAHRETGFGTVYQPLTVVPALSIALTQSAAVIPLGQKTLQLTAQLRSEATFTSEATSPTDATVHLELRSGWTASPAEAHIKLTNAGASATIPFTITPANLASASYSVTAVAEADGKSYREGYKTVGYPGLTPVNRFQPAICSVTGVDVKVPANLRVAYLPGTGDEVASSLEDLGIHPVAITVADLNPARLAQFDAVVLGVRAYAAHSDLAAATPELLDYASKGGTVIVQYNLTQFSASVAPYPIDLGNAEKVVDESAPVTLLDPKAQALTWPNTITPHDFDGWIEERGHGFLDHWDSHYQALTEVHDPGQDPQRGGLLIAPVGKGHYVYLAYALYRQLPEGVPGAYRLFANLLSIGRTPDE